MKTLSLSQVGVDRSIGGKDRRWHRLIGQPSCLSIVRSGRVTKRSEIPDKSTLISASAAVNGSLMSGLLLLPRSAAARG